MTLLGFLFFFWKMVENGKLFPASVSHTSSWLNLLALGLEAYDSVCDKLFERIF